MEEWSNIRQCELAVVGRSNVGKSSLINSITRKKNLARTSSEEEELNRKGGIQNEDKTLFDKIDTEYLNKLETIFF